MTLAEWNIPSEPELIAVMVDYVKTRYQLIDTCMTSMEGEPVLLLRAKTESGVREFIIRIQIQ